MDFEQIKNAYLQLHPPVYEKDDDYAIQFSESDLAVINESTLPVNAKEDRKNRMILILQARKNLTDNEAAVKWSSDMIWNESCGLVKIMIARYKLPGIKHYIDLMGECAKAIYDNIDSFDPEIATLSTFLTLHLVHVISDFLTKEINRNTAYYSKNIRKVETALEYFKANGRTAVTKTDIALQTGLTIHKVEDALINISAKNMMNIDDDVAVNTISLSDDPVDIAIKNERSRIIADAVDKLPAADKKILILYYDLENTYGKGRTIAGVAKELNINADQVEKALRRSLNKLKRDKELKDFWLAPLHEIRKSNKINNQKNIEKFYDDFIDTFLTPDSSNYNEEKESNNTENQDSVLIQW